MMMHPLVLQVLYGIPGSDVTNAPTFWGTVVLNLIFIFGLLVSQQQQQQQQQRCATN
jgi:hypothetical protein